MSALANTSTTADIKQNQQATKNLLAEAISDISVTTRIDYNLRFTKQAVLVVADETEQYSQLASQFLVTLSNDRSKTNQLNSQDNHINVAFVSASTKLNDIQIRCRLIEQLFVNTLFDPEESIAVSVLRFAKQQSEAISIVIDHAHALSLQVKYELSQLVSLAKKNKLTINVVLFGLTEAAQQLSENKSLFKSKMVIIDANSGQVLSFDDKKIALANHSNTLGLWQKLSLLGAMLIITAALIWIYLLIVDDVNKQANLSKVQAVHLGGTALAEPSKIGGKTIRKMQKKDKIQLFDDSQNVGEVAALTKATSEDVLLAILTESTVEVIERVPAKADDVLKALVVVDIESKPSSSIAISQAKAPEEPLDETAKQQLTTKEMNSDYYQAQALEHMQGYVIQIAGFSDTKLWQRFIEQHSTESLHSYQRYLSDNEFTVVTSKVYANKTAAKAAVLLLPVSLIERKPWLKPISSVISEINTFTR